MTRTAFEAFKAGQGKRDMVAPWSVSDNDGMMYFYSALKVSQEYGDMPESEYTESMGISRAYESASIQAALQGETEIIVLCMDLSEVEYSDDNSCENMAYIADCAACEDVSTAQIVKAYSLPYSQYLTPFTIAGLLDNEYFNLHDIDPVLINIARQIQKANIWIDDMQETPEAKEITL